MQKEQAQNCNEEAAGTTLKCRSSRFYTVMQKQQALNYNAEVEGATL
jgi:hypothetical protein